MESVGMPEGFEFNVPRSAVEPRQGITDVEVFRPRRPAAAIRLAAATS
jgi:hypothetical protein